MPGCRGSHVREEFLLSSCRLDRLVAALLADLHVRARYVGKRSHCDGRDSASLPTAAPSRPLYVSRLRISAGTGGIFAMWLRCAFAEESLRRNWPAGLARRGSRPIGAFWSRCGLGGSFSETGIAPVGLLPGPLVRCMCFACTYMPGPEGPRPWG